MAELSINADQGPALYYVHSDGSSITRVDLVAPEVRLAPGLAWVLPADRERALCRALLTHALAVLDQG